MADKGCITFADTSEMLCSTVAPMTVLVEGTQGQLLSLNTSGFYPYTTSRECGPEAILSQIGISPRGFDETEIICVMRTFPIRVGGPSGPLPHEISWEELKKITGGYVDTPERTTVTKKIRRIARMDEALTKQMLAQTCPTSIALTFLDYIFPWASGDCSPARISSLNTYVRQFEEKYGVSVSYVSTGPGQKHTYRRAHLNRWESCHPEQQMGC
jgi:adenylosuccinate synthase